MSAFEWFASFVLAATIVPALPQNRMALEMSQVYPSVL